MASHTHCTWWNRRGDRSWYLSNNLAIMAAIITLSGIVGLWVWLRAERFRPALGENAHERLGKSVVQPNVVAAIFTAHYFGVI